jgi:type IV secretion system protein VirB5
MRPAQHGRVRSAFTLSVLMLLTLGAARPAAAQWAVIDVSAIQQLIQQYEVLEQQLTTLRSQLTQAQQQYAALTGQRGMQQLLSGINRNYLPESWTDLAAVMQGNSRAYGSLNSSVQGLIAGNAVLSSQYLAGLSPAEVSQLTTQRQLAALGQGITRAELDTTSNRFTLLQELINAIPTATDTKGSLDLQARVGAEQTMLANEGTKLEVLRQTLAAEQAALDEQRDEQAVAGIGSLSTLAPMGLPQ